jgi:tetratricopeptide (TPR) repeat protein
MDLDQFFTLGPKPPFQANEVFTNREGQIAAFHEFVLRQQPREWSADELLDFQRAAWNVMTFVGEGGIGKSTLTRRVLELAGDGRLPGLPECQAGVVVDFGDPGNQSFETVVLRMRAGVSEVGRSWPAFDVALAAYWERKHPDEPLTAFLKRGSMPGAREVSEQVCSTLDQFLGGLGAVSLLYRAADRLSRPIVQAGRLKRLLREMPALEPILAEPDPDRMLGYMPVLLAADLERIRRRKPVAVVCLLDTFENVQKAPAERGDLEDLLSRLIYLVPNVAFLVTGRRPLRWHDPVRAVALTYGGESRWPGLAEQNQLMLEGFDETAADSYLRTRLTEDDRPVIPVPIRQRIISGSAGSPLYLELSAGLYERHLARGQNPPAEAFGHPFPELVLRIMRDLSPEDRDLLRAASLLRAFDARILAAILPDMRGRQIETFLAHPFVRHDPSVWPPYRIHDNLRHSVLTCDEYTHDGWTSDERHTRVLRAIGHLTELTMSIWNDRGTSGTSLGEHSQQTVAAFLLSLHASYEHGVLPQGLSQMAYTLSQLGHWQVLFSLPDLTDGHRELTRLVTVARLMTDRDKSLTDQYAAMQEAAGDVDGSPFSEYICFELGSRAHVLGLLDAAAAYFRRIPEGSSPLSVAATFGHAGNAIRRSDYREVAALMETVPVGSLDQLRKTDMLGNVYMHNARFDDAARLFHQALLLSEQAGAPLWAARAARHLAQALMWDDPDRTLSLLPQAREFNVAVGELNGLAQCDLAAAMAWALRGDQERAAELLGAARSRLEELGAVRELLPAEPIEVLFHAALGRTAEAAEQAAHLASAEAAGRPACVPVWVAVTTLWAGRTDLFDFASICWLDSPTVTQERWLEPLRRLRRVVE